MSLFLLAAELALFADLAYLSKAEIEAHLTALNRGRDATTQFSFIYLRNANAQGFVAYDDNRAILAIAGSNDLDDWLQNVSASKVAAAGGNVHGGLLQHAQNLADEIETHPDVQAVCEERDIYLCGHSAGGAVAILLPCLIDWVDPRRIYTYGAPRVLGRRTAGRYPHSGVVRFVSRRDIVPMLPWAFRYSHVGEVRYVDSKGNLFAERLPVGKWWRLAMAHIVGTITKRGWWLHRKAMASIVAKHDMQLYIDAARQAATREGNG